jgi:hypothetical protein
LNLLMNLFDFLNTKKITFPIILMQVLLDPSN